MRKTLKMVVVVASITCLLGTFLLSGCTKRPNEAQLNVLEETKKAALSAEEELAKKQQEKADLENELAEKKQKLEDAKSEKETVKQKAGCE
jgi:chromosome segregation ATPase